MNNNKTLKAKKKIDGKILLHFLTQWKTCKMTSRRNNVVNVIKTQKLIQKPQNLTVNRQTYLLHVEIPEHT